MAIDPMLNVLALTESLPALQMTVLFACIATFCVAVVFSPDCTCVWLEWARDWSEEGEGDRGQGDR
jgi:hypothetical protein